MVMAMVTVMAMAMATHSMRNMQPRQRKQPKRETQGLKYLKAGRQPLYKSKELLTELTISKPGLLVMLAWKEEKLIRA